MPVTTSILTAIARDSPCIVTFTDGAVMSPIEIASSAAFVICGALRCRRPQGYTGCGSPAGPRSSIEGAPWRRRYRQGRRGIAAIARRRANFPSFRKAHLPRGFAYGAGILALLDFFGVVTALLRDNITMARHRERQNTPGPGQEFLRDVE